MSSEILDSVNRLKDELLKRIQLLTDGATSANLDEDAYNELVGIITARTHMSSSRLTSEDITNFRLADIERILEIIKVDDDTKKNIINSFNPNVYSVKNSKNQTRVLDIMKFFEEIRRIIVDYLEQYQMINTNQQNLQGTKVAEYRYYINLFSKENFDHLFTEDDIQKLLKLMSNFAIPVSDRQHILQYIALQNLNVPAIKDPNMDEEYINSQIKNKEKEIIELELESDSIDIDLIPSMASDIAKKRKLDEHLVYGILIAMVSGNLLGAYEQALENKMGKDVLDTYKKRMLDVLELEDTNEFGDVSKARKIIESTSEFYAKEKANKEDFDQYLDMLITEIESTGVDMDTAIDLKTLPIIKSISETLDKIDNTEPDGDEYQECLGVLHELIDAYEKLVGKKSEAKRKI